MRVIGLLLMWCLSSIAQAVVVSDLYDVRVDVPDQTQASRQQALQDALQLVLVKVSGVSAAAQHEQVQQHLARAEIYVRTFRYQRDESSGGLQLEVSFAPNLIDELLRKSQQPVWGKSRPLIVLWQGVDDRRERTILSQSSMAWRQQIERAMSERGIPLLWPAQDLDDQMALPAASLWNLQRTDIIRASERYMADAQMAGRMNRTSGGGFEYRGFLLHRDESTELSAVASDSGELFRQVADQVAVFMTQRYAIRSTDIASGQQVVISGIRDFRQYHDVMAYLDASVAVKRVHVRSVDQENLILELELATDWAQVWSMLALDRRLHETDQPQVYRWQP